MTCSDLRFEVDRASAEEIAGHLERCDALFHPPLSSRVCLRSYAEKIRRHGVTFEAWVTDTLVGLVAAYFNETSARNGFITNVSVETNWQGCKVATALISRSLQWGQAHGYVTVGLEANPVNGPLIDLYKKLGFREVSHRGENLVMLWTCLGSGVASMMESGLA
jgi:ribosomal-protein-alanine N-acetyltransferase